MTVRIVTDSTCDLPADEVERYGITVVPLSVFFGDEGLLDGIDITAADFYGRMTAFKGLPRTSQPSVELFQDAYLSLAGDGVEIVSIHVSSKLSGTLNAASVAREVVKNEVHVDLIDVDAGDVRRDVGVGWRRGVLGRRGALTGRGEDKQGQDERAHGWDLRGGAGQVACRRAPHRRPAAAANAVDRVGIIATACRAA